MLKFDQVHFAYDQQLILNKLSFEVEKGETLAIIGLSGSGKSTVLKLINRLLIPSQGEIYLDGININKLPKEQYRQNIGYVIQQNGLFPHWTVAQNIGLVPKLKKHDKGLIKDKVMEMMEMVSLPYEQFQDRLPSALSGGQQQRVGIARALAGNPDLLLLDEPFSALDPITRYDLLQEFKKLKEQLAKTIIFVTHDIREAFSLAKRVLILDQGMAVQWDTPDNIMNEPANPFVEDLLKSAYV